MTAAAVAAPLALKANNVPVVDRPAAGIPAVGFSDQDEPASPTSSLSRDIDAPSSRDSRGRIVPAPPGAEQEDGSRGATITTAKPTTTTTKRTTTAPTITSTAPATTSSTSSPSSSTTSSSTTVPSSTTSTTSSTTSSTTTTSSSTSTPAESTTTSEGVGSGPAGGKSEPSTTTTIDSRGSSEV